MQHGLLNNVHELMVVTGYFNFCVPLKRILGFAEDFNKVILNSDISQVFNLLLLMKNLSCLF